MADSSTEPLLANESSSSKLSTGERDGKKVNGEEALQKWVVAEIRKLLWLAGPLIFVSTLDYSINVVSIMFVGHAGELELASLSVATTVYAIFLNLLIGMSFALETLCGQAYGAKQYHLVGIYMQRAMIVLYCTGIPVAFLCYNMSSLLKLLGQDEEISDYAELYARYMIPAIFASATINPLVKFLQAQNIVLPMAFAYALTLALHVPICWLLVYKLGFGYLGAAMGSSVSQWLNVIFLVIYVKFSQKCRSTWTGFSREAFCDMRGFFKLAIPSMVMMSLDYGSFEAMVLLSGLLPNPQLESAAISICLNTTNLSYRVPLGLSAAVSTRVSNELGAGRPSAAKRAVMVGGCLGLVGGFTLSSITLSARNVWPNAFTDVPELVAYVSKLMLFLAVLPIMDATQSVLSGMLRGCGKQDVGAYINFAAYYGVGIPVSIVLAFHFHLNGEGLWLGMITGVLFQTIVLVIVGMFTNWQKQAKDAWDRVNTF